jgi:cytochrome c peroxidase
VLLSLTGAALLAERPPGQSPAQADRLHSGKRDVRGSTSAAELGRLLFWDPVLSGNKDVACATCHHPDFGYADGRDLSLGTGAVGLGPARTDRSNGQIPVVKRNAPTVLNTAFNGLDQGRRRRRRTSGGATEATPASGSVDPARAPMLWDSRIRSLEAQALEPLKTREEMRGDAYSEATAIDSVVARLLRNPEYVAFFKSVFGSSTTIDAQQLGQAIAAFERTLVAMNSPFDRFRAGDASALTDQQQRGMAAFDRAGCDRCHEGRMFSDFDLHAEGVRENPKLTQPDAGAGRFRFRTPTLRNVAMTAPYMHNGMLRTLEDVLRFYDNGRSENPNVSSERTDRRSRDEGTARVAGGFRRVRDMSDEEMDDIVAFLEALTDPGFDRTIPARVPSGLPPGGLIGTGATRR